MATLSYKLSATGNSGSAKATATVTLTMTYAVSDTETYKRVTAQKLKVSAISTTSSGSGDDKNIAIMNATNALSNKMGTSTFALIFNGATVYSRKGVTTSHEYTASGYKDVSKTHSTQTKTVAFGSASANVSIPAKPSYTVTYNANSGSGAPAKQTKWYGETLTLSSTKPTKSGYTFKGWATSTANAGNNQTTTTYNGNAAATFYAAWERTYSKPSITNLRVERCDANGDANDEGLYAKVSFNWSVFRTSDARYYGGSTYPYSDNSISSCTITVGNQSVTYTSTDASGPADEVVGDGTFDTDTQYAVTVSMTDSQEVQSAKTTTITGALSKAYFPMDFNADASAMGIFSPAPDDGDGLYIGKQVNQEGRTGADVIYYAKNLINGYKVGFGIGVGGVNHGIYSYVTGVNKWLLYNDGTNTYLDGDLRMRPFAPSISITSTTGTLNSYVIRQMGKLVSLTLYVYNTSSVASGSNIYQGTINTAGLRPIAYTTTATFMGSRLFGGSINVAGQITLRNTSTSAVTTSSSNMSVISFVYFVE